MTTHTQCRLENIHTGYKQDSYIPSNFAKEGWMVDLKEQGAWSEGWKVISVGSKMSTETVLNNQNNYRSHRKATDI